VVLFTTTTAQIHGERSITQQKQRLWHAILGQRCRVHLEGWCFFFSRTRISRLLEIFILRLVEMHIEIQVDRRIESQFGFFQDSCEVAQRTRKAQFKSTFGRFQSRNSFKSPMGIHGVSTVSSTRKTSKQVGIIEE